MSSLPSISIPKRLFLVAPHPDDVHLGAGLLLRTHSQGGEARLVNLTCGDYLDGWIAGSERYARKIGFRHHSQPAINYGFLRYQEDQAALRTLGVNPQIAVYLGYPDGGLEEMRSRAMDLQELPWKSPHTGVDHVPYPFAKTPGAPHTWSALVEALAQEIAVFQPDCIVLPHPNDHHADHSASWWATTEALAQVAGRLKTQPRIRAALDLHSTQFKTRLNPRARFAITRKTPSPTRWEEIVLTPEEIQAKARCLAEYTSQMVWEHPFRSQPPFGKSYLFGYVGENELYGEVLSIVEDEKFQKKIAREAFVDRVLGVLRNTIS